MALSLLLSAAACGDPARPVAPASRPNAMIECTDENPNCNAPDLPPDTVYEQHVILAPAPSLTPDQIAALGNAQPGPPGPLSRTIKPA